MSDIKTQVALKALDTLESTIKNTIVSKANEESQREANFANFLLEQTLRENELKKQEIKDLGLSLSPEMQTNNLDFFADLAGDNNYMETIGSYVEHLDNKNQIITAATEDYYTGQELATNMRSKGLFTSPGETGLDALTSDAEIGNLNLTQDQINNPDFMKGFNSTDDIRLQADLISLDNQLKMQSMNLQALEIETDYTNLEQAKYHQGNTEGLIGKVIYRQLNNATDEAGNQYLNFEGSQGFTMMTGKPFAAQEKIYDRQISELEEIISNSPEAIENIKDALGVFTSTVEIEGKNNAFSGFGRLAERISQVGKSIAVMEMDYAKESTIPGHVENGMITQSGQSYLYNNNEMYASVYEEALAYQKLNLDNIGGSKDIFDNQINIINQQRDLINYKEQDLSNQSFKMLGNNSYNYSAGTPANNSGFNQEFEDEDIDGIFSNSFNMPINEGVGIIAPNFISDLPMNPEFNALISDLEQDNLNGTGNVFTPVGPEFIIGDSDLAPELSYSTIKNNPTQLKNVLEQSISNVDIESMPYYVKNTIDEIEEDLLKYNQVLDRARVTEKRMLDNPQYYSQSADSNFDNNVDMRNVSKAYKGIAAKINQLIEMINADLTYDYNEQTRRESRQSNNSVVKPTIFNTPNKADELGPRQFFGNRGRRSNDKLTER